jgi:hypothetical protein
VADEFTGGGVGVPVLEVPPVDEHLWVWNRANGTGYILGRASRHPGSFRVYWRNLEVSLSNRLFDIEGCSEESNYWLHGLLAGADLRPWFGEHFEPIHIVEKTDSGWVIEEDSRFPLWQRAVARFEMTGVWRYPSDLTCKICHRSFFPQDDPDIEGPLPSDPVGEICWIDNPVDLDSLWPRVGWSGTKDYE